MFDLSLHLPPYSVCVQAVKKLLCWTGMSAIAAHIHVCYYELTGLMLTDITQLHSLKIAYNSLRHKNAFEISCI